MQVYDEITKSWISEHNSIRIPIDYKSGIVIFGYSSRVNSCVKALINYTEYIIDLELYKGKLLFSKQDGMYFSPLGYSNLEIKQKQLIKGKDNFPYILTKKYEAVENFSKFKDRQVLEENTKYLISDYLKYTIGLEFETSMGYIPEDKCYTNGLIPLRDGSITAPEYSTIILEGNYGISLLHQQLKVLKEYTDFNNDCSLHIHFGNFPLKPDKIYNLYRLCRTLEPQFESILPPYTFCTEKYKSNGKSYCKKLKYYTSFEKMYYALVGKSFFGDFTQPHPCDLSRTKKWQIHTRYFWCNFINALCYNVNKTIEFRFLRPTYNFKKILLWIYIFNAMLKYAETYNVEGYVDINHILIAIYPQNLAIELINGIENLSVQTICQCNNGDYIGSKINMENELFNSLEI